MVHAPRLSALCCGLLALCSVVTLRAKAAPVTETGTFTSDYQVLEIPFSTSTTQSYNFYTTSYSGGMNADGTVTPAGGFDPILSLFSSTGNIVFGDAASNGGADAFLQDVLGPGSYILTLTEFPNYSNGTITGANGFQTGSSADFFDPVGNTFTTANYAVNISSSAVTPEPPSALLFFLPLGGVVVLNRRRLLASASL